MTTLEKIEHMTQCGWSVEITSHHDVYFVTAVTPNQDRWDTCNAMADTLPVAIDRLFEDWKAEI